MRSDGIPRTVIPLTALAAGLGWGIRGQYGHETGAMIAGALASLTLVLYFAPRARSLPAARAAAMMAVAIGIGGSMTYGQTVGLTHDPKLVGNWAALRWGLLGLFIKGGIWIGFGSLFLGMGLGKIRYRPLEVALMMAAAIGLSYVGIRLLNSPYDPSRKLLPPLYFSADWRFQPDADLKPRREVWGGFLLALAGLALYARVSRRDKLAGRMALIGFVAGGLGFASGQCIQAFHAWNKEMFTTGSLSSIHEFTRHINWWNMMETTFGLVFGSLVALGLWSNRHLIGVDAAEDDVRITPPCEVALLGLHLVLLISSEFLNLPGGWGLISHYTESGLVMSAIPLIAICGGRMWPYLALLPVIAVPICGKTLRELCFKSADLAPELGWLLIIQVPIALLCFVAASLIHRGQQGQPAARCAAVALLTTTWLYFSLNTGFFRMAWPWDEWTNRTANQLIYDVCVVSLTVVCIRRLLPRPEASAPSPDASPA